MDPITSEAVAGEAARGVDYIASKNDRWLLIALCILLIAGLLFELHDERTQHEATETELVKYLSDEQTKSDEIIERNTAAFESVNDTLKLLSRRP